MPLGILATGSNAGPEAAHAPTSRTPIRSGASESDLCRMPSPFRAGRSTLGPEHIVEADQERNELRIEMWPEDGPARIGAAAARHLGTEASCVSRVHIVVGEEVPGLHAESEARRHRQRDADERPEAGDDIGLTRGMHADRHHATSWSTVRVLFTGLVEKHAS